MGKYWFQTGMASDIWVHLLHGLGWLGLGYFSSGCLFFFLVGLEWFDGGLGRVFPSCIMVDDFVVELLLSVG